MTAPRKYIAASVPRFIRQSRLGYLPAQRIIGSKLSPGQGSGNLYFDIVMAPAQEFQRIKNGVSLAPVVAPNPQPGLNLNASFIMADIKEVVVPPDEADPEQYAKNYFLMHFGLLIPEKPAAKAETSENHSSFSKAGKRTTESSSD